MNKRFKYETRKLYTIIAARVISILYMEKHSLALIEQKTNSTM